jgi:hypothetical protein
MQTHRGIQRILVLVSVIWVLFWSVKTFDAFQESEKNAGSDYRRDFDSIEPGPEEEEALLQWLKAWGEWNDMSWRERPGAWKRLGDSAINWLLGNALGLTVIWGVYFSISWVVAGFRST